MFVKGDKIITTKEIFNIPKGEVFEVTDVENDLISFEKKLEYGKFTSTMSFNLMETCFEKHVEHTEDTMTEITIEWIEEIINNSTLRMEHRYLERTSSGKAIVETIAKCILPNGFEISCSYESSDECLNIDVCRHQIFNKVFELESYRLHSELHKKLGTDECPYDCSECPCEGCNDEEDEYDECLDTDLDCDDCDDYNCVYNRGYLHI